MSRGEASLGWLEAHALGYSGLGFYSFKFHKAAYSVGSYRHNQFFLLNDTLSNYPVFARRLVPPTSQVACLVLLASNARCGRPVANHLQCQECRLTPLRVVST